MSNDIQQEILPAGFQDPAVTGQLSAYTNVRNWFSNIVAPPAYPVTSTQKHETQLGIRATAAVNANSIAEQMHAYGVDTSNFREITPRNNATIRAKLGTFVFDTLQSESVIKKLSVGIRIVKRFL